MNVFTFYEPVESFGNQNELINLWIDSWKTRGWNPVVIDQKQACTHKNWVPFNAGKIHSLPTRNPLAYERACWHRWFAFEQMGGGVMSDYDVMNNGLTPDEVIIGHPLILEQHRVPCVVAADANGAKLITDHIMSHQPAPRDGHYSDMLMFIDSKWPHIKICKEPGQGDWKKAKLIHFSARACQELGMPNKAAAIYKYL